MGLNMGLKLILVVGMVATNILSLYHLSPNPNPPPVPDFIKSLRSSISTLSPITKMPPELQLHQTLLPTPSTCATLLHSYMNYTPFTTCPTLPLPDPLLLQGCHPLPRRRCFSPARQRPIIQQSAPTDFTRYLSQLDLPIPQLISLAASSASPLRLGLDLGGGSGAFASQMRSRNVTVLTVDLGSLNSQAAASIGVVPLHAPLQQRLPVFDGVLDFVRCGRAVNRWIPVPVLEFLFGDVDRVLRGGGYFWIDRFFGKRADLEGVYSEMIGKLGYRRVKWAVVDKSDSLGIKNGEVYLTALLQKPNPA